MKRFGIRNYGPTRQLPYKAQHIFIVNDGYIETDDVELVAALKEYEKIHVTDHGVEFDAPVAPPAEKKKSGKKKSDKKERKVTVDDAEALHAENFPEPEEASSQEAGGTEPPAAQPEDELFYEDLTVPELKVLAKDRELDVKGLKKAEIIEALQAYDAVPEEPEEE